MASYRVAKRYALALLESAEEGNLIEEITRDVGLVRKTLEENRELRIALGSPVVQKEKKKNILTELFENKVHEVTLKFLDLVLEKDREKELPEITEQFLRLVDEKRGVVRLEVSSAVPFSEEQQERLRGHLENFTGKRVIPRFRIDPSILGGFVVRLDDQIIDASVARQLELLRARFTEKV